GLRYDQFAPEKSQRVFMTAEPLNDRIQLPGRKVGRCEFRHDTLLALICAFCFPLLRGGTMTKFV
ncbi:MAG: hypothetical protein COU72_03230, partial [Parcubacteria group bacterium CG10_big_fil_rev_8_21_14_0_10_41_35]